MVSMVFTKTIATNLRNKIPAENINTAKEKILHIVLRKMREFVVLITFK